jgi:uracil-DNA glycosylase family 4
MGTDIRTKGPPRITGALEILQSRVIACRRCPRLVRHCRTVAREKVRRFEDWSYWGRPVPSFGDPAARIVLVGLAPAAHGANRTGRMFTGDRSGDFLFAALHRHGLANQAASVSREDGLHLRGVYITAAVRCAPPGNRPTSAEEADCRPFLLRELELLHRAMVLVALGGVAWRAVVATCGTPERSGGSRFGHGAELPLGDGRLLLGCYHPSQQNTFTGRLTPAMMDRILRRAVRIASARPEPHGSRRGLRRSRAAP